MDLSTPAETPSDISDQNFHGVALICKAQELKFKLKQLETTVSYIYLSVVTLKLTSLFSAFFADVSLWTNMADFHGNNKFTAFPPKL